MSVEHLSEQKTQIGTLSTLEHMIALGDLRGHLNAFLLSCKVDELSPRTIGNYAQKLGAFIKFLDSLGANQPIQVTVNHIRMFQLKLQERCKPESVKDYYIAVKRFFNWMVAEGILERNPMANMRPPKVPHKLIQPFTASQIAEIVEESANNPSNFLALRNKAIILTFLDTGLRLSELASIQLRDLDFDRDVIKVMGKGARERLVGIGKRTQKAILRYVLSRNDAFPCLWVTEERRPLQARGIQIMIRRLGKRLSMAGARCSCHTFRHTFGTCAMLQGATEREVQLLLGHTTERMTKRYTATITSEYVVLRHKRFSPVDRMGLK